MSRPIPTKPKKTVPETPESIIKPAKLFQLRKMVQKFEGLDDNTPVEFALVMTALWPSVWKNMEIRLNQYYTAGYLQAVEDEEKRRANKSHS